jgi:DNA-binding NarL/FixJ family response regulator
MTRVLIVAPTPALRAGLRALLASADISIASEVATLAALDTDLSAVDVILVADGALLEDATRAIGDEARLAVLALAGGSHAAELLRALPLIGWGVLPPNASPAELQATVHTVAQGLVVLPAPLIEQLLGQRGPIAALASPPAEPLTAREREVLELVSQGLSNKLIARELQVSEHTVKFHISSIFAKLGAASRTEAISRGARQGLITL